MTDTPPTPNTDPEAVAAARRAAQYGLSMGKDRHEIVTQVIERLHWPREDAEVMVDSMIDTRRTALDQQQIQRDENLEIQIGDWNLEMIVGVVSFVGGILVTLGTFFSAVHAGGGTYTVAFGAIIGGAILFLRGTNRMNH